MMIMRTASRIMIFKERDSLNDGHENLMMIMRTIQYWMTSTEIRLVVKSKMSAAFPHCFRAASFWFR